MWIGQRVKSLVGIDVVENKDQSIPNFADIAFVSASPISANIQFVSCSLLDLYKLYKI